MKLAQVAMLSMAMVFGASLVQAPDKAGYVENRFEGVPAQMLASTVRIEVRVGGNVGSGSGVCINDKQILTAAHLFAHGDIQDTVIVVYLHGKKYKSLNTLDARLIKIDTMLDMAMIEVEGSLPFSSEVDLTGETNVGDPVFIVGAPGGFQPSYAYYGFLATKGETSNPFHDETGWEHCWTTSAFATHGNSGGPVFNANTGKVIGLVRGGELGKGVIQFVPTTLAKKWLK